MNSAFAGEAQVHAISHRITIRSCRPGARLPHRPASSRPPANRRSAFTLVEMLISVTLTLLVVFAIVQVFELLGNTVTLGRATMEMSGQLRLAANLLQQDLDQITCRPVQPWVDPDAGKGYFFVLEGPVRDADGLAVQGGQFTGNLQHLGDVDDVLAMTVRSRERPFTGRIAGVPHESPDAEVIWWTAVYDLNGNGNRDADETLLLLRRAFLISPQAGLILSGSQATGENTDLSLRPEPPWRPPAPPSTLTGSMANALSDLTLPEDRVSYQFYKPDRQHLLYQSAFPRVVTPATIASLADYIVLTDVVAFDVRVYDPLAPIQSASGIALLPGDTGYASATNVAGAGAFVDLSYLGSPASPFAGRSTLRDGLTRNPPDPLAVTYDTWSSGYERNGIDEDGNSIPDQATNGLDDDGLNGVDDAGERETSPPYNVPLRGIEVRIRMIDPSTGQVRQVSVVGDFVSS